MLTYLLPAFLLLVTTYWLTSRKKPKGPPNSPEEQLRMAHEENTPKA